MTKISCIYQIKSSVNNRIYIGSSINFNKRKSGHLFDLVNGKHGNKRLQNHFNKYGKDVLEFSIIEIVDNKYELLPREQFHIDDLKPYFNICKVAGNCLGRLTSEETKLKQSLAKKGKKQTPEAIAKRVQGMIGRKIPSLVGKSPNKGRKASLETRKKLSDSHKGQSPYNKGVPRTEAQKLKQSLSMKGRGHPQSEETKDKLRIAHLGKIISVEQRLKISNKLKGNPGGMNGKKHSEETKTKIGLISLGRKHSEEIKAKISASMLGKKHSELSKLKISETKKAKFKSLKLA